MRRTVTVVGVATGLVMTATGAYASAPDGEGSSHAQLPGFSASAEARSVDDQARTCLGKKQVRRARVFVSYKRLNHLVGMKGTYWAGTYRVWDVCRSKIDLSAYVQKRKGKLRVYQVEAPLVRAGGRVAADETDAGSRGCISKRTVKRKLRPDMTYGKAKKVLGGAGTGTATSRAWKGCFGTLKLGLDRVKGKRRVDTIDVLSAA
ncbi:hypothetical protein [Solicola gregarius]|uniref:Secreted protein n=1 Tax=Solicola gregarius TaxID=2908642 RepID=A0AA46TKB3_9ACTN|nr:hypothetical protein [Solicola gregarius]UYM06909.1 hypothetical protein L0C25_07490 [Solicola gregarius]